jgi:hypothetical protein
MYDERLRRALLLALCVLVFLFALHAKTGVYNGGAPARVTPSTASKLWLSGQKMEVQPVDSAAGPLFFVVLLCVFALCLHSERYVQSDFLTAPSRNFSLRYVRRFLRPPPFQA